MSPIPVETNLRENVLEPVTVVDGPLLARVREIDDVGELRRLLAGDVRERGRVHADEAHPFDRSKPFIVYPPMNRQPEIGVGLATLKISIAELGLADRPFAAVFLPRSAEWMRQVVPFLPQPEFVTVVDATKDRSVAEGWGEPYGTFYVSPYVQGRLNGDHSKRAPVYVRDPEASLRGKMVVGVDDVIAEGPSGVGLFEGISQWGPAGIALAATLSKRVQGGVHALHGLPGIVGVVEAIPIEKVLGPGGGENIIIGQPIRDGYQRR